MRKLKLHELNRLSPEAFGSAQKKPVIVVLDNIRSMHNVGSVFRTADAFLVEKIWLCGYTPRPPHRDIHKVAIGAEDTVEWGYQEEIIPLLAGLKSKGYTLIAIEQTAESQNIVDFSIDPKQKYVLIFGNEVGGVQQAAVDLCDFAIEIPQYGTKHSLNISVTVGIVLYKFGTEIG